MPDPMPQRPSRHELMTRSARAFEARLPSGWTAQERDDDYGIDFDVAIFRNGAATGLGFHVQLKGTQRLRGAPKATIKWTTRNYWAAQERPTLVVLWEAETDRLWAEWSHRMDVFGLDQTASKTFQFRFPPEPWTDDTPSRIETEVEAYRAWATARHRLPITVVITPEDDEVAGVPAGLVVAGLRQRLRDFHTFVKVRVERTEPLTIDVRLARDQSVLWLSGGPSTTLHHEGVESISYSSRQKRFAGVLAADLALLVAYQLGLLQLDRESARVVGSVAGDASLVRRPEMAATLLHVLCEQERTTDAIALTQRLLYEGDDFVSLALMDAASTMSLDERRRVSDALLRWGNEYEINGHAAYGAAFAYNASRLIGVDDMPLTISLLDRAAELDPAYAERGYWWRERAGMRFSLATTHKRLRTIDEQSISVLLMPCPCLPTPNS